MALERIEIKMPGVNSSDITFKPLTPKEREQFQVDSFNEAVGNRDAEDGYNCPICKNKAFVARLVEHANGTFSHACGPCKCEEVRRSILRMRQSGLKDIIKDYTFDRFEAVEDWQKALKGAAQSYAQSPAGWFFIGGQVGSGKTHLCTAICRELLLDGRKVKYMLWRDDVTRLKGAITDPDEYGKLIDAYKSIDVLYIDDLFKTGKGPDGGRQMPTGADINAAFEILNFRYNNPKSITIISSEHTEDELIDIDEATGSRIFERAKAFNVGRDRSRNYRLRRSQTL